MSFRMAESANNATNLQMSSSGLNDESKATSQEEEMSLFSESNVDMHALKKLP